MKNNSEEIGFKYKIENKRYHTYNYYLRNKFHEKVFKVSINGGFTCPNIDGKKGYGGCIYCSKDGSGDFAGDPEESIREQFIEINKNMEKKWPNGKKIAYFQAFTNTYAPVEELEKKYETALRQENVVGIAISTRPDCLPDDVVDYLSELNNKTELWVELGLQTIHESTSKIINRKHSLKEFEDGYNKLREKNIKTVIHIIDGLPGEDHNMMIDTAKYVASLKPHGIKIHLLHVLKDTVLENLYNKGGFRLLEKDEYIQIVCDQLEVLPEDIVIHRLTGDGKKEELVGPLWSLKKWEVLNAIDDELNRRNSWQGKYYKESKVAQ